MRIPLWVATTARRRIFEAVGLRTYSMPGYAGIERALMQHLPPQGFFVEAGAVDGFFESNTYFLERFYGWRGVLVEPTPRMFRRIKFNRPRATAFNCALVSSTYRGSSVTLEDAHAVSRVVGGMEQNSSTSVVVPARTLTSLLDEIQAPEIDLLSLDVEGYELEVLRGLDFSRYAPRFLLVECLSDSAFREIREFLCDQYRLLTKLNERDVLYQLR